ncbi:HAD-IA family hydrolase [Leptolyngbya sp. FACHB-261]|uniref:HAD-IA family hydrolase n=1 Tax=Leptolyngbya sp. FACHB-261 TaxID=2692806 RepID=UPI001683233F|nr:HAD-IA family hydrolase [Leptolyngbya sp. FACHB-261]MBD2101289.1 HAD-IA family hydrolase [Leptolyngbya sp. FACHB-261]
MHSSQPPVNVCPKSSPSGSEQVALEQARPQAIFLDAVGTLFGVQGSVGEVYGELCQRVAGVKVNAAALDQAFYQSFRESPAAAFPDLDSEHLKQAEYQWWYRVAQQAFERSGYLPQFTDFEAFFPVLYQHFETAEPWQVYDDTRAALAHWRDSGITLAIVSNFDTRLFSVLKALDLAQFINSITISTQVGAAKPDPLIFKVALDKHGLPASDVWHVGDSYSQDYLGAAAAGLQAFWLNRPEEPQPLPEQAALTQVRSVSSLLGLPKL